MHPSLIFGALSSSANKREVGAWDTTAQTPFLLGLTLTSNNLSVTETLAKTEQHPVTLETADKWARGLEAVTCVAFCPRTKGRKECVTKHDIGAALQSPKQPWVCAALKAPPRPFPQQRCWRTTESNVYIQRKAKH